MCGILDGHEYDDVELGVILLRPYSLLAKRTTGYDSEPLVHALLVEDVVTRKLSNLFFLFVFGQANAAFIVFLRVIMRIRGRRERSIGPRRKQRDQLIRSRGNRGSRGVAKERAEERQEAAEQKKEHEREGVGDGIPSKKRDAEYVQLWSSVD